MNTGYKINKLVTEDVAEKSHPLLFLFPKFMYYTPQVSKKHENSIKFLNFGIFRVLSKNLFVLLHT